MDVLREVAYNASRGMGAAPRPELAVDALRRMGELGHSSAYNDAAWLLATCPDPTIGDRSPALQMIQAHLAIHGEADWSLDTLAAAYAAIGDYASAEAAQLRALQLTDPNRHPLQAQYAARLALYRRGVPAEEPSACRVGYGGRVIVDLDEINVSGR